MDFWAKKSFAPGRRGHRNFLKTVLETLDHTQPENNIYKILNWKRCFLSHPSEEVSSCFTRSLERPQKSQSPGVILQKSNCNERVSEDKD